MLGLALKKMRLALGSLCAIALASSGVSEAQLWQEKAPPRPSEQNRALGAGPDAVLETARDTRPKVAIVIDDVGLDWERFQAVNRLPVPATLAFLPYGIDAQRMVDSTDPRHTAIMHMPMEPKRRKHHAGPGAVKTGKASQIRQAVNDHVAKLSGYRGVNNHTGSAITENKRAMETVLSALTSHGLYFLDSKTTPDSQAAKAAENANALVLEADMFLDGDFGRGGSAHVLKQLAQLEALAAQRGSAIAIGHPYPSTITALNSWALQKRLSIHFVTTDQLADEARASRGGVGL